MYPRPIDAAPCLTPARSGCCCVRSWSSANRSTERRKTVHGFAPELYGLSADEMQHLSDDRIGRALDQLFDADRSALLTAVVVAAVAERFGVKFDEVHNDSTSIKFCEQYRAAAAATIRGRRPALITYGYSKDHRPDLKQLLFILTTTEDGG